MHAAHHMQTDRITFKKGEDLKSSVCAAIGKKQDILPIVGQGSIVSGVFHIADIIGRIEEIDLKDQNGLIDTDYPGVTPDASMEQIISLHKGNARPCSIIVHDNRGRFLGIIPTERSHAASIAKPGAQ